MRIRWILLLLPHFPQPKQSEKGSAPTPHVLWLPPLTGTFNRKVPVNDEVFSAQPSSSAANPQLISPTLLPCDASCGHKAMVMI